MNTNNYYQLQDCNADTFDEFITDYPAARRRAAAAAHERAESVYLHPAFDDHGDLCYARRFDPCPLLANSRELL